MLEEKAFIPIDAIPEPALIFCLKTKHIIEANDEFLRLVNLAKNELIGKTIEESGLEWEDSGPSDLLEALQTRGSICNVKIHLRSKLGSGQMYTMSSKVLASPPEHQVLSTMREISPAQLAESQAKNLFKENIHALRVDRLRSMHEMASNIAHEINQPLVGVRGMAELLYISSERGWNMTPEEIIDKAQVIIEQADRIVQVIQHLKHLTQEAIQTTCVSVDLNGVVRAVVDMLGENFREQGFNLKCDLADDLPKIQANPFALEEALLNVIHNAKDAYEGQNCINRCGKECLIHIQTKLKDSEKTHDLHLSVKDTGCGIDQSVIEKIFEPFFTLKEPGKGIGLGLPVTKAIVEQLGGRMRVASTIGKGTTVTMILPTERDL